MDSFDFRFNYHLEKVRDIVNNAFTNLLPIDEPDLEQTMDIDEYCEKKEVVEDIVEKRDKIMCDLVDQIPF